MKIEKVSPLHVFKQAAFFSAVTATSPLQAQEFCADVSLRLSYLPVALHTSDKDAPVGGYNETSNHGIATALKCDAVKTPLYYALGLTTFSNSLFRRSNGIVATLGYETNINKQTSIFGEVTVGLVTGYKHLPQVIDGISPYGMINIGATHKNISIGIGYIPGSLAGSDDVFVPNISYTIPLGGHKPNSRFNTNALEPSAEYNLKNIRDMSQWRMSM